MINTSYFWSYFVRPLADVPSILKCLCDEPRLRLGEPLSSDIILSATDKHGNKTGKVRRFVQRHCKPITTGSLKFQVVYIKKIQLRTKLVMKKSIITLDDVILFNR